MGVNGKLANDGQGFININAAINSDTFGPLGQELSSIGSIIPLENGAAQDVFFLAFEDINGTPGATPDGSIIPFNYSLLGEQSPYLALRNFDEINQSFPAGTGVASTRVAATSSVIRRQLPAVADFQAFMSSHHMAVTQLAAVYCGELVRDAMLPSATGLFAGFDFSQAVLSVSDNDWSNEIIYPLIDQVMNTGLESQPSRAPNVDGLGDRDDLQQVLLELINDPRDNKPYVYNQNTGVYDSSGDLKADGLKFCDPTYACPTTEELVKAVCTAVLASGAVQIH